MALTSVEQNKVVQLLGYGGKTIQAGSVIYNKILNDRLNQVTLEMEALIRSYLQQIAVIETQMNSAPSRLMAEKVGDININLQELPHLRRERRRIAREIAQHLDIPYQMPGGVNMSVVA